MSRTLLLSTALFVAALGTAIAHTDTTGGDTPAPRSEIAKRLPAPAVGPNATRWDLLGAAKAAIAKHKMGVAQEALEEAEARSLSRSVVATNAGSPSEQPVVKQIVMARDALARHDAAGADQAIDAALAMKDMHDMPGDSGMPPSSMPPSGSGMPPAGGPAHP